MSTADFEQTRAAAALGAHGFRFKKKYGQNFITDPSILDRIVEAAGVTRDDFVVEIGAGMGTLTEKLCEAAGDVLAIEIDYDLIPILEERLTGRDNVLILRGDVMKLPLEEMLIEGAAGRNIKVVANLPYYITTPIIMMLLEDISIVSSITVMVQKEVAARMQAEPGTKDYGALTLAIEYYTESRIDFVLPAGAFYPPPKVDSAVITLKRRDEYLVEKEQEKLLFGIIRSAFNQRRKTLVNALANGGELSLSKDEIQNVIEEMGFSPNIRGEVLSLEDFIKLGYNVVQATL